MTDPEPISDITTDYDEWEADDARRLRECTERGLVIVRPADDELQIDIDNEAQLLMARMGEAIVRTWRR